MEQAGTYRPISSMNFFKTILTDIVKYEFNYKLSDNRIIIYVEDKEVISYKKENLRNDFLNYLVSNFSR